MLKKTMNTRKIFILLRSFCLAVLCLILVCPAVFTVSAAGVDYKDYISNIEVDGDNDLVTVTIPANKQYWLFKNATDNSNRILGENGYLDFECDVGDKIELMLYVFDPYLNLADIPNNTAFSFGFRFNWLGSYTDGMALPYVIMQQMYYDDNMSNLGDGSFSFGSVPLSGDFQGTGSILKVRPSGTATRMEFRLTMVDFIAGSNWFEFQALPFTMTMSISSLYRLQQETGRTNELLEAVEDKLEQNGQKLEDILNQQQQTNDKLDKLPGEIGDEVQDVIENEKAEAESSGNDFVDQILDSLPDPSTEVLSALKSLTDATSYSGTDAVLPIPAIVLPGVDGLFPETEVWGGAELDFEQYLSVLPPALLTLVQSLFTIAIVVFCVFELKGIISYCLTLRESKGG